jgi:hypothetical protein
MAVRRVTSTLLVSDVAARATCYRLQGFQTLSTDEPKCLVAEPTYTGLMLLGRHYARPSMPTAAVAELEKGAGLYVWVDSLADVVAPVGTVLGEIETDYGTRERYVSEEGGLVACAEKIAA